MPCDSENKHTQTPNQCSPTAKSNLRRCFSPSAGCSLSSAPRPWGFLHPGGIQDNLPSSRKSVQGNPENPPSCQHSLCRAHPTRAGDPSWEPASSSLAPETPLSFSQSHSCYGAKFHPIGGRGRPPTVDLVVHCLGRGHRPSGCPVWGHQMQRTPTGILHSLHHLSLRPEPATI